jgi:hypothetical protein
LDALERFRNFAIEHMGVAQRALDVAVIEGTLRRGDWDRDQLVAFAALPDLARAPIDFRPTQQTLVKPKALRGSRTEKMARSHRGLRPSGARLHRRSIRARAPGARAGSAIRELLWPLQGHHPEFVFTYVATRTRAGRTEGERYPLTYAGVRTQWLRLRKRAGVSGFRFHDHRHNVASKLLRATGNLKLVLISRWSRWTLQARNTLRPPPDLGRRNHQSVPAAQQCQEHRARQLVPARPAVQSRRAVKGAARAAMTALGKRLTKAAREARSIARRRESSAMPCTPHAWEGDMNDDIETPDHQGSRKVAQAHDRARQLGSSDKNKIATPPGGQMMEQDKAKGTQVNIQQVLSGGIPKTPTRCNIPSNLLKNLRWAKPFPSFVVGFRSV